MTSPKRIGIAVVEHAGRYLAGIREPNVPLAGFAEFPGGKCLPNESFNDCAVRECHEESGLMTVPVRLLQRVEFEYPHGRVDLSFVLCHLVDPASVCDRHRAFRWVSTEELKSMKFPEANSGVIDLLTAQSMAPPHGIGLE
jgi:8-oxo-dGTP diphosphatase